MKLLIDNCLSIRVATRLAEEGHDVDAVGRWPMDPGDENVLARAAREGRVLITTDRGFGNLVVAKRLPSAGLILLRKTPAAEHAESCLRAIREFGEYLARGGFVVVMRDRIRARTLDPDA